jgi:6-phosphogluconolactonase
MTAPEVYVVRDRELLLEAVAARLVTRLVDHQAAAGSARVLLGGDPLVADLLAGLAVAPARDAVDWTHLDLWWSDDTWAPQDDLTRASRAARRLLDAVGTDAALVHPMPVPGATASPEQAAADHAAALAAARAPDDHGLTPTFDIAVLGLGPDGGLAGLRPEQPAVHDPRAVAVDRATNRLTLTLAGLASAREVWLLASGEASSSAAVLTLTGAGPLQVPAAGVRGTQRTLLLLDAEAASRLPSTLRRLASP